MKRYGVRDPKDGYIYYADGGFEKSCKDDDELFGTDDINEAFRFMMLHNGDWRPLEVFEKLEK